MQKEIKRPQVRNYVYNNTQITVYVMNNGVKQAQDQRKVSLMHPLVLLALVAIGMILAAVAMIRPDLLIHLLFFR